MKILESIKDLIKKPFSKKEKEKNYKDGCQLFIDLILKAKNSQPPNDITKKEWEEILRKINFGLEVKKRGSILKSPTRRAERQAKTQESFLLLEKHIKEL